MEEETVETNTETVATPETTESQPVTEPVSETKPVAEDKTAGETDQQFRSGLGRRVSRIEDSVNSFIQEMRQSAMDRNAPVTPDTSNNDPQYVTTEEDVKKVIYKMENERTVQTRNYNENYLNHLARLGMEEGLNDTEFNRLEELTKTTFNALSYRDPSTDAERNFLKAMRIIDRERLSKNSKTMNLKGDNPVGTGIVSSNVVNHSEVSVKLDKHAQDFVNHYKISSDKVSQILKE